MRQASAALTGEHDFTAFMASGGQSKTQIRRVYDIDIEKSGEIIAISVRGNGFLYNMVRIIAGTLLYAGTGKINPADVEDIIKSRDRTKAGATLPAHGLYLMKIIY
jgi:tRNA pseudouridine38-40 synthase